MPTGGIFGFVNSLRQIERTYRPDIMIVAFDCGEPTFRHEMDESYKQNREAPPEDLLIQLPYVKKILEAWGIPAMEQPGYEADDILGTLADRFVAQGWEVVIASSDKDLLQMVNDHVRVLRQHLDHTKIYGEEEVLARYRVGPDKLVDVLALMGDSSDNVAGVPGIGEKTAVDLIARFGSLEGLYSNVDQVKGPKRRESLLMHKEQAFRSRELVTLRRDVPLDMTGDSFSAPRPDCERLLSLYRDLEFRHLARELEAAMAAAGVQEGEKETEKADYQIIRSVDHLKAIAKEIERAPLFAVDVETTSLNIRHADLVGLSVSVCPGHAWYIPTGHREGDCIDLDQVIAYLGPLLSDPDRKKCGQNLKFDVQVLARHGIKVAGIAHDSLIGSYLAEPERSGRKLGILAADHLGMRMTPIEDLIGSGKHQRSMADVPVERVGPYCCEDSDAALRLCKFFDSKLDGLGLRRLYQEIEIPLVSVLARMETRGVRVDPGILEEQSHALGKEIRELEAEIYRLAGHEFNVNSPAQLAAVLYDEMKLAPSRRKSTRADILERLAADGCQIAQTIMEYRQRAKLQSTYLDALKDLIDPATGRVHTNYNQAVTNTGRLSSSDPNLQNIPIRTPLGRRVRRAFVAEPGNLLLSADYSQIELRILAHLSQDPGLLNAFRSGEDIHQRTAAEVFNVPLDQVSEEMRRKAKAINFGLNYGMSPYGLSQRLGIRVEQAEEYIQQYFTRYPLVRQYMDRVAQEGRERRWVTTLLGRRIPTHGIDDSNRARAENARRAAINAPIQGSAADLLKKAMVDCHRRLAGEPADMILTVHDELIFEVDARRVEEIAEATRQTMEGALAEDLSVPTPVEISWGENWAEL
jgi:DNA polymerase-1